MAKFRLPGPLCTFLDSLEIDTGTLCLAASPAPGPMLMAAPPTGGGATPPTKVPATPAGPAGGSTTPVAKLTKADFDAAASTLGPGVAVAIIRAFAEVESGGKSGFGPEGLPVIAYEGHIFRKYTNKAYDKDHPLLSYKYVTKAGPEWKKNNKDQATAWKTLGDAMALDHDAALQSCSWGMFQVMGFNYSSCGYPSVDDFVTAMKAGERGQLDAFVGFCKSKPGMVAALKAKDFIKLATLYNGADFGDYDKRIEKAYKKYGGT